MVIECVGMIGAGKSTVARQLAQVLAKQGWSVLTPQAATDRCWRRGTTGRLMLRLVPDRWHGAASKAAVRLVMAWFGISFALQHGRLAWQVCAAQRRRTITWGHRWRIVRLFFEVAAAHHYVQRRLTPGEAVIFEEGLIHRAINVYAWEPGHLDPPTIQTYLQRVPVSDLVVFVDAPFDVCVARAEARGLPLRLRDKDAATVQHVMRQSAQIMDIASAFVATAARPVLRVDNGGTPDNSVRALRSQLPARLNRHAGVR